MRNQLLDHCDSVIVTLLLRVLVYDHFVLVYDSFRVVFETPAIFGALLHALPKFIFSSAALEFSNF